MFRHEAYGRPVDVYSFAMILYNLLPLTLNLTLTLTLTLILTPILTLTLTPILTLTLTPTKALFAPLGRSGVALLSVSGHMHSAAGQGP